MPEINNTTSASLFARELQVRTLQHKLIVFLVALLLFLFWPMISGAWTWYVNDKKSLENTTNALVKKTTEESNVRWDLVLLKDVSWETKRAQVIQCYNTNCKNLPTALQKEPAKSAFKAFLQLQQAGKTKFTIDQKKLLMYLNEFLVRSADGTQNGQIESISFSEPIPTSHPSLVRIATHLQVVFPNKQSLFGFLRNTEQLISTKYPMLTVVNSVTYDIVKSDESQNVDVALDIYMMQ
jgi:hypothetical protein